MDIGVIGGGNGRYNPQIIIDSLASYHHLSSCLAVRLCVLAVSNLFVEPTQIQIQLNSSIPVANNKQISSGQSKPFMSAANVPAETLNWQQLFAELRPIISAGDAHEPSIRYLLDQYKSKEADYKRYVHFDASGYTKNLIEDFGQQCNVIVMCWAPGQTSTFHGHEGSKCFVKVLAGELIEQQVNYPKSDANSNDAASTTPTPVNSTRRTLKTNQVTYVDDDIGLHRVSNASRDRAAITLHIYMPAYKKCRIFNQDKDKQFSLDKSQSIRVTFHSRFGLRGFGDR